MSSFRSLHLLSAKKKKKLHAIGLVLKVISLGVLVMLLEQGWGIIIFSCETFAYAVCV